MEPDKAIEILNQDLTYTYPAKFTELTRAIQLGRGAIKRILTMRSYNISQALLPLPGENPIATSTRSLHSIKKIMESPLGREPKG